MKTIIIINDNSEEAFHAAKMAFGIAEKVQANLLIANESKVEGFVTAGEKAKKNRAESAVEQTLHLAEYLSLFHSAASDFKPGIEEIDISDFANDDLTKLVIGNSIWMMVTGAWELADSHTQDLHINIQTVLNHVMCPLLVVPRKARVKDVEQIIYLADLRYCRLHVVKFLAELAAPYKASIYVDHLSAKGLPDMEQDYALTVFNNEIFSKVKYERLYLNNVEERDVLKAVDVLVNNVHADVLVMVNHRFHFEEIVGRHISHILPQHITVPLLIFPC
jgi:hypothetical protein